MLITIAFHWGSSQPRLCIVEAVEISASSDMVRGLMRYTVYDMVPQQLLPFSAAAV